jgi:hypothetical protein
VEEMYTLLEDISLISISLMSLKASHHAQQWSQKQHSELYPAQEKRGTSSSREIITP